MEMNLQNHPKFQALSPEAKKIALDKYAAMSPEAQQVVNKRLYAVPEDVKNEPGLQDVSLTPATESDFQQAGEGTAEALGKAGVNPYLAGAAGTAVSMAPDIAMSVGGFKPAKAGAEAGTAMIKGAKGFLTAPGEAEMRLASEELMSKFKPGGASNKLRTLAEQMIKEPTENIAAGRKAIMDVGLEHQAKKTGLEQLKKEAGARMGAAEETIGAKFKSTPEFEQFLKEPKKVAKFAQHMEKIGSMKPEELASKYTVQDLQTWRKTAQEASKTSNLSDLANASMQKGREAAAKAMEIQSKEFGLSRDTYKGVINKLDSLPTETKARQNALKKFVMDEQGKLTQVKKDIADLKKAAAQADKEEAAAIKQKAINMIRKGQEQDRKIRYLKNLAYTAVGLGTAGTVISKIKGN